jgi:heat shock protein HtpX
MFKNSLKTAVLLAALGGLLMAIGSLFGQGGLWIGLVLGLVMVGGSYWFSDKLAIASARAKPVSEAEAPQLHAMIRDLSHRARIPMPRIYMSPEMQPNAFATGRSPKKAAVCVTQGIVQVLEPEELKGVLAHELAHVDHRDILIGSVAAAVAMGITFVARMAMFGAIFGGGRDRDSGNAFAALAMAILAPLAAAMIQMAISRSREFEADRGGAALIGSGEPLARALEKIDVYARQVPMNVNPATENLYIISPFSGKKPAFAGLFSTHPPVAERVRRLRGRR